jgi:hypothetical protein
MVQVLRLSKIARTAPPHFRVVFNGSHGREIHFGSERDIRKALLRTGLSEIEADRIFNLAKADENRER